MLLCVYVSIHKIAHDRATRPCHASRSILLAAVLPRGDHCDCVIFLLLRARAVSGNARSLSREECLWRETACLNWHGFGRTGIFSAPQEGGEGVLKAFPVLRGGV